MRCFIALPIPQQVMEDLDAFCEPRRQALPDVRWSDPLGWHLTVAFLPDVAQEDQDDLEARLAVAASRRRPMQLNLHQGGAFPDALSATVLWTGVTGTARTLSELDHLASGCRNAAAVAGTGVQGGRFLPHVTLARFVQPRNVVSLLEVLALYSGPTWRAESVRLIASHLGEGPHRRPRYETLAEFPLG
ncbi:RNA 2',3'-cyclic phosphodiesterase [Gephyromycinifex aptenodytis]|uniref:RNA 2',3'-cyclic phosphodiesterase n=1 Tax=Gephyromycinifex aptenodytis TaxID=2716227 RepID=UPI001444FF35|nr:RNA 2',3'-cyclic phosphodiesterase [Gephyromycinifex aptenodytis]